MLFQTGLRRAEIKTSLAHDKELYALVKSARGCSTDNGHEMAKQAKSLHTKLNTVFSKLFKAVAVLLTPPPSGIREFTTCSIQSDAK